MFQIVLSPCFIVLLFYCSLLFGCTIRMIMHPIRKEKVTRSNRFTLAACLAMWVKASTRHILTHRLRLIRGLLVPCASRRINCVRTHMSPLRPSLKSAMSQGDYLAYHVNDHCSLKSNEHPVQPSTYSQPPLPWSHLNDLSVSHVGLVARCRLP